MLMFRTRLFVLALACLALAQTASAQVAHLSFRCADDVLGEVRKVAEIAGRRDLVGQLDGVQLLAGPNDYAGVDRKKPFGVYVVRADQTPICVAAFLPVADEKKLLTALPLLKVKVEDDKDGVRTLTTPDGLKLTMRFAHGHAHLAPAATPLPDRLPDPARFLPAGHRELIMGDLQLDRLGREGRGALEALGDLALRAVAREDGLGGFKLMLNPRAGVDLKLEVDPKNSAAGLDLKVKPPEKGRLGRLAELVRGAAVLAGKANVEVDVALPGREMNLRLKVEAGKDVRVRLRTGEDGKK
jgi:hypothetical protein